MKLREQCSLFSVCRRVDRIARAVLFFVTSVLDSGREALESNTMQECRTPSPLGEQIDQNVLLLGVTQWAKLFGMINFELFGTFNTVFDDADALFAASLDLDLAALGVT